jgi:hypothetical protein
MNPYRNALRVITRRYMDDFQYGEELFETEDGLIPFDAGERNDADNRGGDEGDQTEFKEAA